MSDNLVRRAPWLTLGLRTGLFAGYQAIIALILMLSGVDDAWGRSVAWWPLAAVFANSDTLVGLWFVVREEGGHLGSLFTRKSTSVARDALWMLPVAAASAILLIAPVTIFSEALFEDPSAALTTMLQPLPVWAAWAVLIFMPPTLALAELPAYYGFAMPRIKRRTGTKAAWVPLLVGVAHAAQHCTLPLVFDVRFMAWRFLTLLPLTVFLAYVIDRRPSLLPMLMALQWLLSVPLAAVVLGLSMGVVGW